MYRRELESQLDLAVDVVDVLDFERIEPVIRARDPDLVFLLVDWALPEKTLVDRLRRWKADPRFPRIVFVDYYAPTSTPHFGVLPWVDAYVKRQVLVDRERYQHDLRGGYVFTDYLSRELGYDLDGWHFGSKPDAAHLDKLVVGWNMGAAPRYRRMLRVSRTFGPAWHRRPYALHRRLGSRTRNRKREWYQIYRDHCADRLEPLGRELGGTPAGTCARPRYLAELFLSRMVFSPFGWGELCFRDFEAVAAGALLLKPDMSHLETRPNVFVDHETYVPLRWDLSDLAEKCRHYAANGDEACRIVRRAQEVMSDYFDRSGFVDDVRRVLDVVQARRPVRSPADAARAAPPLHVNR